MMRSIVVLSILVFGALLGRSLAAQQFPILDGRSLAMGRSAVATVDNATAAQVNPAALAGIKGTGLTFPSLGLEAYSPTDFQDQLDIIDDIVDLDPSDPNNSTAIITSILQLDDKPTAAAEGYAFFGVKLPEYFTLSYTARGVMDLYVLVDKVNISPNPLSPNFVGNNETSGVGQATWFNELGFTYATALPFLDECIQVGVTGIGGYAITYNVYEDIYSLAGGIASNIDWLDRIRSNREDTFYADLTAGAQAFLFKRKLVVGVTGRRLLRPTIDFEGRSSARLDPQFRVGVAFRPFHRDEFANLPAALAGEQPLEEDRSRDAAIGESNPLTITVDYDLTKNSSIMPGGIDTQYLGGGVEYAPLWWFAVRAGAFANLAEDEIPVTFTAGAKLAVFELGAAWAAKQIDEIPNDVRVSLSVNVAF